ncbi:MAG: carbohydrate kinase [Candidatus Hydrogenedens sp.]|nr:carbohydrate kinase [Candidatus Hydrogenedens sp.]
MPKSREPCVLAIDLGTSGPKAGVISESGGILGAGFCSVVTHEVGEAGYEQEQEAVWQAVLEACRQALRQSGVTPSDVVAVLCDSYYFTLFPIDCNGRPTMNAMLWLDKRGAKEQRQKLPGYRSDSWWSLLQWIRLHGIPPLSSGIENVSKLRWIKQARPEVYERTAYFLEPSDYIAFRLTGRVATNPCTVFAMQTTDTRRGAYSPQLLRYSGIDPDKFPEILPNDAVIGTVLPDVAEALGISTYTKVLGGVNDTQAGAIGSGAFQGTHAGVMMGSSGGMVAHFHRPKTDVRTGAFTLPAPWPDVYFLTGESGTAGRTLEHFLTSLIFADDPFGTLPSGAPYERLEDVVSSAPPGCNGLLFLPWLTGSQIPVVDGDIRAGFLNLTLSTNRADMSRAVLEGIVYLYRQTSDILERAAGRRFSHYRLYGGGALSRAWSKLIADMTYTPVHRMAHPRMVNCVGLGLLAFHRLGLLSRDDMAERVAIAEVVEPDQQLRSLYEDKNAAITLAFKQNRSVFRRLNGPQGTQSRTQSHD